MKNKTFLLGLLILIMSSCSVPAYLPSFDQIDVSERGSHIRLVHKTKSNIEGELISIDNNEIVVLVDDVEKCMTVPVSEVKRFSLRYAQPKNYDWTIPVFTLATLSHGWFLFLSAPVNLIVTISVTVAGENAFKYSDKNMTYDQLRMFSRFPQGIPPNIDIADIK